ncbi:MAG: beta-ketoacyl-[acyl-carrier-protein] synthase family protein [Myxococcota bacterium]
MSRKRVVVTGVGMINAVGLHVEEGFSNMMAGKSGARPIRFFDASDIPTRFACEPPEGFEALLKKYSNRRFISQTLKFSQFGYVAVQQMLEDYPVDFDKVDRERVGVPMGVSGAGVYGDPANTWAIVRCMSNAFPAWVTMKYGLSGPSFVVSTACASSADSIATAYRMIQSDELDMAITGGADATVTHDCVKSFNSVMALSERNNAPEKASRPFDRDRDGFVMGEGAGVLILEELEHAKKRGAKILAEMLGFASYSEAANIVAPKEGGAGMIVTMRRALKNANVSPDEVDYISAHGTSTKQNDQCEALAIREVFGKRKLMISSQKSMVGHCIGAAGGIETVTTVLTLNRNLVTPTINLDNVEPGFEDMDFVPNEGREAPVHMAVSNSFAFGGHNCSLVFKKYEA